MVVGAKGSNYIRVRIGQFGFVLRFIDQWSWLGLQLTYVQWKASYLSKNWTYLKRKTQHTRSHAVFALARYHETLCVPWMGAEYTSSEKWNSYTNYAIRNRTTILSVINSIISNHTSDLLLSTEMWNGTPDACSKIMNETGNRSCCRSINSAWQWSKACALFM